MSDDYAWPFSFPNVCRLLNLIKEAERKFHWPLGRRPDAHPGLSDLGLWEFRAKSNKVTNENTT